MREVKYVTMTDLTRAINRDLMHGWERTSSIDNDFLYKVWKETYIFCRYFVVHLRTINKVRLVQLGSEQSIRKIFDARSARGNVLPPHSLNPSYALDIMLQYVLDYMMLQWSQNNEFRLSPLRHYV